MAAQEETAPAPPEAAPDASRSFDFKPALGLSFEITHSTEDTAGGRLELINWIDPGMAGPPVHVHPAAEESYEVLEGSIEVFLDGSWSELGPGEKATVPIGAAHSVRNLSDQGAKIINIHQPAQKFEAFFKEMADHIEAGKIKSLPPKDPRTAIYAAMHFTAYPEEIRTVKPPNGVFKALAGLGKALRFRL